eukprot:295938-Chlamydomonas_euryale.AAC.5
MPHGAYLHSRLSLPFRPPPHIPIRSSVRMLASTPPLHGVIPPASPCLHGRLPASPCLPGRLPASPCLPGRLPPTPSAAWAHIASRSSDRMAHWARLGARAAAWCMSPHGRLCV